MAQPSKISALTEARRKATLNALRGYKSYICLLRDNPVTQTSGLLIIGKRYIIFDYKEGDDFTNVGATWNGTVSDFIATGTTPTNYTNGSLLAVDPVPVATVIENTYDSLPYWIRPVELIADYELISDTNEFDIDKTVIFIRDNVTATVNIVWETKINSANNLYILYNSVLLGYPPNAIGDIYIQIMTKI